MTCTYYSTYYSIINYCYKIDTKNLKYARAHAAIIYIHNIMAYITQYNIIDMHDCKLIMTGKIIMFITNSLIDKFANSI